MDIGMRVAAYDIELCMGVSPFYHWKNFSAEPDDAVYVGMIVHGAGEEKNWLIGLLVSTSLRFVVHGSWLIW